MSGGLARVPRSLCIGPLHRKLTLDLGESAADDSHLRIGAGSLRPTRSEVAHPLGQVLRSLRRRRRRRSRGRANVGGVAVVWIHRRYPHPEAHEGPPRIERVLGCHLPRLFAFSGPERFVIAPPRSFLAEVRLGRRGSYTEPVSDQRKVVTVLRCDIEASREGRSLDEELRRRLVAGIVPRLDELLSASGATVRSLPEDALLAIFGLERAREDDAMRAVLAAVEVIEALKATGEESRAMGVRIEGACSINTGQILIEADGYLGGAALDAAAVLSEAAGSGGIVIGAETYRLVGNAVEVEPGGSSPIPYLVLRKVRSAASTSVVRLDAPMIGRAKELEGLSAALELAAKGEAQLVSVVGEPGVGKSRLIREFLAANSPAIRIMGARCPPYGAAALHPVVGMVEKTAGIGKDDNLGIAKQKLLDVVSGREDSDLVAQRLADLVRQQEEAPPLSETFWAIRTFFEHLSADRPLIVAIEDLHWAQPTLLDLIEQSVDWLRSSRLLLLTTARPVFLEQRGKWGKTVSRSVTLTIDPIDPAASAELIRHLLGHGSGDLADRVVAASGGNPLFIEQLVAMMIEMDLLTLDDGVWRVADEATRFKLPATMASLLSARLDRLELVERDLARRASIPAGSFTAPAIVAMMQGESGVDVGLRGLVRKGLLRPTPSDVVGEDAYEYAHALLKDTAYETLTKELRASLHERHASWLEQEHGDHEEAAGYHYERAYRWLEELGPPDERTDRLRVKAAELLGRAGEFAFDQSDYPSAASMLGHSLDLLGEEGLLTDRSLMEADALREAGDVEAAGAKLAAIKKHAEELGDELWVARADLWTKQVMYFAGGGFETLSWDLLSELATVFERSNDRASLAKLYLLSGIYRLGHLNQPTGARDHLEKALFYAEGVGTAAQVNAIRGHIPALTLFSKQPVGEGLERLELMRKEAEGDRLLGARIDLYVGLLRACLGETDEAERILDSAFRVLDDLAPLKSKTLSWAWYELAWMGGDKQRAERELREAIRVVSDAGVVLNATELTVDLAGLLLERGQVEEVVQIVADAEANYHEMGEEADSRLSLLQAALSLRANDLDGARAAALRSAEYERQGEDLIALGRALLVLAKVHDKRGESSKANQAAQEALALFERKEVVPGIARARALSESVG